MTHCVATGALRKPTLDARDFPPLPIDLLVKTGYAYDNHRRYDNADPCLREPLRI